MPDYPQDEPKFDVTRPHVALVIDESSSMAPSRQATISSVNEYLESLKGALPGTALISVYRFAAWATRENVVKIFDRVELSGIRPITDDDYSPHGNTPLYDALGEVITSLDLTLKSAPAPVYVAVVTDGAENASKKFAQSQVKTLIDQKRELGWTFVFMGVDIDAYDTGHHMGFTPGDTVSLSRGVYGSGAATQTFADNVGRKYKSAVSFAASGGDVAAEYGLWNRTDATFTDADRARLEADQKTVKNAPPKP